MKYCIIGAGGTGGCLAAYLARSGKDVSLIARGEHLNKIKSEGLKIETAFNKDFVAFPKAYSQLAYAETPDVIFVCVKSYSVDEIIPFIKRVADTNTIIIPLLNIYTTGEKLQAVFPELIVTDGCIYISSSKKEPGTIKMSDDIFRVVFGLRDKDKTNEKLYIIRDELVQSGITAVVSDNIKRDAMKKFAYVSPMAACGLYYNAKAGEVKSNIKIRNTFVELMKEVVLLSNSENIVFDTDVVADNLKILDNLNPEASTSMQRDIWDKKESEIDGLIFEVVRQAEKQSLDLPLYKKIAKKNGFVS